MDELQFSERFRWESFVCFTVILLERAPTNQCVSLPHRGATGDIPNCVHNRLLSLVFAFSILQKNYENEGIFMLTNNFTFYNIPFLICRQNMLVFVDVTLADVEDCRLTS